MSEEKSDAELLREALAFDDRLLTLWDQGKDPEAWAEQTAPRETLIWRSGHGSQIKDLYSISHLLGIPVRVAGKHTSKSVGLPVGMFAANIWCEECVAFFTRNNFHDLKLVVVSSVPIDIPYDVVHREVSQKWYDEQKRRSFDYCRPKPERGLKGSHDWNEADYETDAWYKKWGGGELLRDDGKIYSIGSVSNVYYEGINTLTLGSDVYQSYRKGMRRFAVEVPGSEIELMRIMRATFESAQKFVHERREDTRDLEDYGRYKAKTVAGEVLSDWETKRFGEITARLAKRGIPLP